MTYQARPEFGGIAGVARAQAVERRVHSAIALCQILLVIRIMSVLLLISFLPEKLPNVTLEINSSTFFVLPLHGISGGSILLVAASISAIELYLVHRLGERSRAARLGVLLVESLAILATATALALGPGIAALPLTASVGAVGLLLLNQVRWAFRLRPQTLTGHRTGGVFAGYAAPPLDSPKPSQGVGYIAPRYHPD